MGENIKVSGEDIGLLSKPARAIKDAPVPEAKNQALASVPEMVDSNTALMMMEEKPQVLTYAFANYPHEQQKYIIFNINATGNDRLLSFVANHELFHTLDFDHPIRDAIPGEIPNSRSLEQLQQDIASRVSSATARGTVDANGIRHITYSFAAEPSQIPYGNPAFQKANENVPGFTPVLGIGNLADGPDAKRNAANHKIKEKMRRAFKKRSEEFGIVYDESPDPNKADLFIYSGAIPNKQGYLSALQGARNAYTHNFTVLTYNQAEAGVFPTTAVGDIYMGQNAFGLPPKDPKRHTITDKGLIEDAGVFWDHAPMMLDLHKSEMAGALKVDLSAHPISPAIVGTLTDKEGKKRVWHHVGFNASIKEVDAAGSNIAVDITLADEATFKAGHKSNITLNGQHNNVVLGPGVDTVTLANGHKHVITGLSAEDSITAKDAAKANLEYWNTPKHQKGTRVAFTGSDGSPKGSLFLADIMPDKAITRLKNIHAIIDPEVTKPPIHLDAILGDLSSLPKNFPQIIMFNHESNYAVVADEATGHWLSNTGAGGIIVKMNKEQYDYAKKHIAPLTQNVGTSYYPVSFAEGKMIQLEQDAKLALVNPAGRVEELELVSDLYKNAQLKAALKKGATQKKPEAEVNHKNITAPADIPLNPFAGKRVR